MIFALAGNQNCGKTTLFNNLTGANQHVGNFPGVTVERKMGEIRSARGNSVVDLPGIYSLRPYSGEEAVALDFLLNEKPDGIINIVDATNIERNLYLTLQLMELDMPMVLALNMMDELRLNGGSVDVAAMSKRLGIPVVAISAVKNEGVAELVNRAIETAQRRIRPSVKDFCPEGPVHRCIHAVSHLMEDHAAKVGLPSRYAATRLIEDEPGMADKLGINQNERELIEHAVLEMEHETGLDRNAAIADMRYTFIEKVCADTVKKGGESRGQNRSVAIDRLLTGRYLALPLFFGIMMLIFYLTFGVLGSWLSDLLSQGIDAVTALADRGLEAYGINLVVHSLIIDGVFAGVGSVLSFLPVIVVLFFFLSILEDTGYMARVAFIMDKLLRKIGLSGRSFVRMLLGFGCSVPAIMAARTLASERDRTMTILLVPYMSCSAKIPIYAVFCAAFFPRYAALVMMGLYLGGMLLAVVVALLLKGTLLHGKPAPLVMELPPYRMPSLKCVLLLLWDRASDFLRRAFTIIFVATVIIWILQHFDAKLNVTFGGSDSLLAMLGRLIAPVLKPLGFGDWRIATALVTGFTAKEAVVSTLGVLLGVGASELTTALGALFTIPTALGFLAFTLLYTPCVAAVAAMRRELNPRWKTLVAVLLQCVVAWAVAFAVLHIARLF
jgi:ferrous iron transport protein B